MFLCLLRLLRWGKAVLGNLSHAEPPAAPTQERYDIEAVHRGNESAPSESRCAPGISENEVDELHYRPLLRAAIKGDWDSARRFFDQDPASKTAKITNRSETLLHIAALSAQDQFVEKLVRLLSPCPEALEMTDRDGQTALHIAVRCGRIRMVRALVRWKPRLTQLQDNEGRVPLDISAWEASAHKDIAWFLAVKTTDDGPSHPFSSPFAFFPIFALTIAGHHDITLYLVDRYPHLITLEGLYILQALALVKSNFRSGTRLGVLEQLIYKCIPVDLNFEPTDENLDSALQRLARSLWSATKIVVPFKRIHKMKLRHAMANKLAERVCAATSQMTTTKIAECLEKPDLLGRTIDWGILELMELLIKFFPELIWLQPYGKILRTNAVECRQENILRLFLKRSSTNELLFVPAPTLDESQSMMMAAAEYKPNSEDVTTVSGAAFELQRELQWFKVVEMCLMPDVRTTKHERKTYCEIFKEKHDKLRENGEKWVKGTAESCMLVSTLIATVLFAAAFTVPGGSDNNTGVPLLIGEDSLLVFVISDALGLSTSVMAIMFFLAILTSRYEWEDFLHLLQKKIIMGLFFLFLSLVFMLTAFAATLTIVLDKRLEWVLIPSTVLASMTVFSFLGPHLALLFQMFKSTYGHGIFRPMGIQK